MHLIEWVIKGDVSMALVGPTPPDDKKIKGGNIFHGGTCCTCF